MTTVVACFVSPHGFGHAARVAAALEALSEIRPDLAIELFTTVPRWFFEDSLSRPFGYHSLLCDVGLAQRDALSEDLVETERRLAELFPPRDAQLDELAARLRAIGAAAVVADIAPLALAAATRAGLPSLLLESFTWDWIYRPYGATSSGMRRFADLLGPLFALATRRVRCVPFCGEAPATAVVPPISRRPRTDRSAVRRALGIPEQDAMVLVTMGGIEWSWSSDFAGDAVTTDGRPLWLLLPGGVERPERCGRSLHLPHRSGFFHPDLVHAADGVIGKLGYSTVAEVWATGVPFAFVRRPGFPESAVLEAWCRDHLSSDAVVGATGLAVGDLWPAAARLASQPRRPSGENGAVGAAAEVAALLADHPAGDLRDSGRAAPAFATIFPP